MRGLYWRINQGHLKALQMLVYATQRRVSDRLLRHWGQLMVLFILNYSFILSLFSLETICLSIWHHGTAWRIRRNQYKPLLKGQLALVKTGLIDSWYDVVLLYQLAYVNQFWVCACSHVCNSLWCNVTCFSLWGSFLWINKVFVKSGIVLYLMTHFCFNWVCGSARAFAL